MIKRSLPLLIALVSLSAICNAQSPNLLKNPNADQQTASWRVFKDATVEDSSFVVRNGGYFLQDVELPDDAVGQYAVFVGRGSTEWIDPNGTITGVPYLYGYMMVDNERIVDYLQGQNMRAHPATISEWSTMWGIFQVPVGTTKIRFFLNQGLHKDVPHNGSAARFDDLGLYLFATHKEARDFATQYGIPR
ncbi:MAG TPA: hypothetical protein VFY60_09670 [Pyrinomonadaceae bacterium]|nr:hypothetical protein [Pyrinomonadaceae bacterium]